MMWIRIACVCAIMFAAFAHQPVAAGEGNTKVSEYALPDGTILSLCIYIPAGENGTAGPSCEFCRIADAAIAAPPCGMSLAVARTIENQRLKVAATNLPRAIFQPATPLRGPPTVS
ncbi:hypothetical protein [Pararhizobium sp. IMCC21322]|uniref:hypothetical protein n=1 Tax=Pararhizobium sp. IMCC21322 TaxID=3067903 RepID=UPI002741B45F|nr:hypothetical protein [Pararhizobium sp. IMCC21322]